MRKDLKPPVFEEDLKTFPKKPLWMYQVDAPKGSIKADLSLKFTFLILIILCLIIALGSL